MFPPSAIGIPAPRPFLYLAFTIPALPPTPTYTHTHTHTQTRAHMCVCEHTHALPHMHTHMCTHIHAHPRQANNRGLCIPTRSGHWAPPRAGVGGRKWSQQASSPTGCARSWKPLSWFPRGSPLSNPKQCYQASIKLPSVSPFPGQCGPAAACELTPCIFTGAVKKACFLLVLCCSRQL